MISSQHISIPQDNLNHGVVDNIVEHVSQKEEGDEEPFGTVTKRRIFEVVKASLGMLAT